MIDVRPSVRAALLTARADVNDQLVDAISDEYVTANDLRELLSLRSQLNKLVRRIGANETPTTYLTAV